MKKDRVFPTEDEPKSTETALETQARETQSERERQEMIAGDSDKVTGDTGGDIRP